MTPERVKELRAQWETIGEVPVSSIYALLDAAERAATARADAIRECAAICKRHENYYRARDKTTHENVAGDLAQSLLALLGRQP